MDETMATVVLSESGDKAKAMPDDIWIDVFKYFGKNPVLFNLYNMTSQFVRVLDMYFKQPVTIDVKKYIRLNEDRNVARQVVYLMQYCNRTIDGIVIKRNTGHIGDAGQAVQAILHRNRLGLKLFHCDVWCAGSLQLVHDVVPAAVNLVDLRVNLHISDNRQPLD